MNEQQKWTIYEQEHGTTLLSSIAMRYKSLSKKAIKRAIDEGRVFVNKSKIQRAHFILAKGDLVTFYGESSCSTRPPVSFLYEDEYLVIISKPAGMISSEKELQSVEGINVPYLVHRLDKETSGILIIAKNSAIQAAMEELFRKKEVKKSYLALTQGTFSTQSGSIQTPLVIEKSGEKSEAFVRTATPYDRKKMEAKTNWELLLSSKEPFSLLKIVPITGKTHQIRVHLSSIGHPLIGEKRYGVGDALPLCTRHMLHAFQLEVVHPVTRKKIGVQAPIPDDFSSLIYKLFGASGEKMVCELL